MTDEIILDSRLKHYLYLLRRKRRKQQLDDILLAIILNKEKTQDIIEAIESADITSETKEELIKWLNKSGIKK